MTVGLSGWYEIRVTGEKGGYGQHAAYGMHVPGGTGGDLIGRFYLKQGDLLQTNILKGGTPGVTNSNHFGGAGGRAMYITVNSIVAIGAGGGGGSYYATSDGMEGPDKHTNEVNNKLFSAGGGGSTSAKPEGGKGQTITGCVPAEGFEDAKHKYYGSAGQNYLSLLGYLVQQNNGSENASFNVKYIGDYNSIIQDIDTSYNLRHSEYKNIVRIAENGRYYINAALTSGSSTATFFDLKVNDIVKIVGYDKRFALYINDIPIILLGLGSAFDYKSINSVINNYDLSTESIADLSTVYAVSAFSSMPNSSNYYWQIGTPTIELPSTIGASTSTIESVLYTVPKDNAYHLEVKTKDGDTLKGKIIVTEGDTLRIMKVGHGAVIFLNDTDPVLIASSPGGSRAVNIPNLMRTDGQSWFNTILMPAQEYSITTTQEFLVTLTCRSIYDDMSIGEVAEVIIDVSKDLEDLKLLLSNIGSSAPFIHAIKGQKFVHAHAGYDDMDSGSNMGITVKNNDKTDGYIDIEGTLHVEGIHKIKIHDKLFMIKVVVEPDSQSVTTLL